MGKELELAIKISGKIDRSLGSAIKSAQAQLNAIGNGFNKAGAAVTSAVVAAGAKLVVDSVQTYKDYQSALNSAAATAGVKEGTKEYEMLNQAAREAGKSTVKTAKESANALEYMALAGWSVEDSTRALMPVLKLSAATNTDLATTSDLVTDSMANLGLSIDDLNHYLDVSATANNKSNQTAMQLQEAYLGVGGVLKNLNAPIEESAAVLGVLANRGTKGSEAGTALSAILVNMQKKTGDSAKAMSKLGVSMYDAQGKARSIIDVFQDISNKTTGMTEQQRNLMYQMIGGKSHVDSFAKIMAGFTDTTEDGQKEIYSLMHAFQDCDGALDSLYDIKMDTLEGSIATLSSAYDDMKISIGEKISPYLNEAVKDLTSKMPDIEKAITGNLEHIIPAMSSVMNFVVNNADTIINALTRIAAAYTGFKITTGVANGINSMVLLGTNLQKIARTAGVASVLKGTTSALLGIAPAALSVVAPLGLAAAAIVGIGIAIDRHINYSKGMDKQAEAVEKASQGLVKYNSIAQEVQNLRAITQNPESSTVQIDMAKQRLQEIAEMLNKEYNLVINADTTQLEQAINLAQQASRGELIETGKTFTNKATAKAESYANDKASIAENQAKLNIAQAQKIAYGDLANTIETTSTAYDNGTISQERYMESMNKVLQSAREQGIQLDFIGDTLDTNAGDIERMSKVIYEGANQASEDVNVLTKDVERQKQSMDEHEQSVKKAGNALIEAFASDMAIGNLTGADTDISLLTNLGAAMHTAGVSTQELSTRFAAAAVGYNNFADAVAAGKASEMASQFIDFQKSIGETAESAVSGASLIANGFENAEQAISAGDAAVKAVVQDLYSLGTQQGLFDNMDVSGIADKMSDIAHAMGLIPANKSISIDANGDFSVIEDAENQIASLKSVGNVNVSVNANGDFSVLNKAAGEMEVLQGLGAVSLQVNADGNIDVLDKAQQVIATIDSKSAQVNINGNASGMAAVEAAEQTANSITDKTATVTVTANDNASATVQNVQSAMNTLNATNANPTATVSDQATGIISNVKSQLESLNGKTATTVVITRYETQGTPPGHTATGTANWRGGLTYVNDQKGIADPREVIEYGGNRWWYEGKNVLADVPKGARIYTAAESKPFINGSHKNGLDNVPFDGYIAELHEGERVLTADENNDYAGKGMIAQAIEAVKQWIENQRKPNNESDVNDKQVVFAPNISVTGSNISKQQISDAIKMSFSEFKYFMERYESEKRRKAFT